MHRNFWWSTLNTLLIHYMPPWLQNSHFPTCTKFCEIMSTWVDQSRSRNMGRGAQVTPDRTKNRIVSTFSSILGRFMVRGPQQRTDRGHLIPKSFQLPCFYPAICIFSRYKNMGAAKNRKTAVFRFSGKLTKLVKPVFEALALAWFSIWFLRCLPDELPYPMEWRRMASERSWEQEEKKTEFCRFLGLFRYGLRIAPLTRHPKNDE